MSQNRDSLKPIKGVERPLRERLSLKDELVMVLLPTAIVLAVLALVEVFSQQPAPAVCLTRLERFSNFIVA